jgi:hypothetical protein
MQAGTDGDRPSCSNTHLRYTLNALRDVREKGGRPVDELALRRLVDAMWPVVTGSNRDLDRDAERMAAAFRAAHGADVFETAYTTVAELVREWNAVQEGRDRHPAERAAGEVAYERAWAQRDATPAKLPVAASLWWNRRRPLHLW